MSHFRTLNKPQIYVSLNENYDLYGISMFWTLKNETFLYQIDEIRPCSEVVATVVLDLPKFNTNSLCEVYGTILYEVEEEEYQIPIPVIHITIEDTIDSRYQVKFLTEENQVLKRNRISNTLHMMLALKSSSMEKTIDVQIKGIPERETHFLTFLKEKSFQTIYKDIYIVQTIGTLMHCLIEILPITEGKEKIRISSRSNQQMNLILRLLRQHFPYMIIEEDVNPIRAAMALIEELKLYLENTSTAERQMARIRTDLLIPRQARHLENDIDAKLVAFSKLGVNSGSKLVNSDEVPLLDEEHVFENMASEIEALLTKLFSINERMGKLQPNGAAMLHTMQRHKEILKDYKLEFSKIRNNFATRRDREDLLGSVRKEIDNYKSVSGLNRREMYLKENQHIHNSDRLLNDQISIAIETRDHLMTQRQTFKRIQTRLNDISNRFPAVNSIVQRINLRKRRDSLILGLIIGFCTFLMLLYAFH
ncbi:Golgi SNAP receptor complex member 1 [Eufriesea mexicana]|uniref:Golgi SNAP receptor complex member 1 n=1 Tax=Eufriesea mexicana TaxID=516756 RepID=A0A310S8I9_9HYME|nr:Golgi SNAP receptor complex member 1 [Eufriesea mexicana]